MKARNVEYKQVMPNSTRNTKHTKIRPKYTAKQKTNTHRNNIKNFSKKTRNRT